MRKTLNLLLIIMIFVFFFNTYKFYSSNINLKVIDFNRKNLNQIINEKINNIPVLSDDTNNVIIFNNSLTNDIKNDKPRSFWDLLNSK